MRLVDALTDIAISGIQRSAELGSPIVYTIPNQGDRLVSCNLQPVRLDIRRDLRLKLQVARQGYVTEGVIQDDAFSLPFGAGVYDTTKPIKLMWYGANFSSTAIVGRLYNAATDAELTEVDSGTFANGGWRRYQFPAGVVAIYAKFTLTGDGTQTPMLRTYRVTRPAIRQPKAGLNLECPTVQRVAIQGADRDPSTESARVQCSDLAYIAENPLRLRADYPVRIETQYDPSDPSIRSWLFTGRVREAKYRRKGTVRTRGLAGSIPQQYPNAKWGSYDLVCVPEWEYLAEQLVQKGLDLSRGELTDVAGEQKPMRVTDAIKNLLEQAGYDRTGQIDVPTSDLRFFVAEKEALIIEPYSSIGQTCLTFARDYLGGYLVWDPNASGDPSSGYRGMWRLKYIPSRKSLGASGSGYRVLAAFEFDVVALGHLAHSPASYPDGGSGTQPIKRTFVRKGSWDSEPYPPEFNKLRVTGVQTSPSQGIAQLNGTQQLLTMDFVNPASTQFPGYPAPVSTHPDYLGYIREAYYADPVLTSEQAVRWVGQRLSDLGMHGGVRATFEAPLLLIWDTSDPYQVAARPLRFGDAITVDGSPFFIDHVQPDYASGGKGGDRLQMALYSVFYPSNA